MAGLSVLWRVAVLAVHNGCMVEPSSSASLPRCPYSLRRFMLRCSAPGRGQAERRGAQKADQPEVVGWQVQCSEMQECALNQAAYTMRTRCCIDSEWNRRHAAVAELGPGASQWPFRAELRGGFLLRISFYIDLTIPQPPKSIKIKGRKRLHFALPVIVPPSESAITDTAIRT